MNDGLGEGSAKNRAATYIMLSEGIGEDAAAPTKPAPRNNVPKQRKTETAAGRERNPAKPANPSRSEEGGFTPELAVNVQIHISADASSEQIEAIFASMRKHFSK